MQNVNKGHSAGKRKRRTKATPKPKNGPVQYVQVNLRVWIEALRLAGHDTRRIDVIDSTTVIVRNRPVRHG